MTGPSVATPSGAVTPSVAVVMPAYNEADRIVGTFEAFARHQRATGQRSEERRVGKECRL